MFEIVQFKVKFDSLRIRLSTQTKIISYLPHLSPLIVPLVILDSASALTLVLPSKKLA